MTDFSLFETMRHTPGEGIARLNLHLKRLETSARRLGFDGAEKAEASLAAHLGYAPHTQRIRLELSPAGEIAITATHFTLQPEDTVWRIAIARTRTPSTDPLIRHKTTQRALYETARAEFPADTSDEVLLLNEKGELTEGTITNLFVEDDEGRLMTPPLSSGCLAGVLRTSLICARKAYNHRLRPEDLEGRKLYVGNSLRGLVRAEFTGK
jgi:4-amino-4-deoxychorismate lyase